MREFEGSGYDGIDDRFRKVLDTFFGLDMRLRRKKHT